MDIVEARRIFGINEINPSDEKGIRSIYKKLAVKYHPDNIKDDGSKMCMLNDAYNTILKHIEQLKSNPLLFNDALRKVRNTTQILELENVMDYMQRSSDISFEGDKYCIIKLRVKNGESDEADVEIAGKVKNIVNPFGQSVLVTADLPIISKGFNDGTVKFSLNYKGNEISREIFLLDGINEVTIAVADIKGTIKLKMRVYRQIVREQV